MPTSSDLVTDLPADFEVFGQAVDTQMKTNADAATQKSTLTTKGDIYAATAASTPSRLGVGSNGQVLTADSTASTGVKWATPSAGSLTLLSTTTLSGTSTTISSISQAYTNLIIEILNPTFASSASAILITPNSVDNVFWGNFLESTGTSVATVVGGNFYASSFNQSTTAATYQSVTTVYDYATTNVKPVNSTAVGSRPAIASSFCVGGFSYTTAISSLKIFNSNSTSFNGGTVYIYGVN